MLGICLKRYNVNNHGHSYRLGTHVDIPLEMATPHFAEDGKTEQEAKAMSNVKLSLQSVVCHRGHSVEAGHYISFVRAGNVGSAYGLRGNNRDSQDAANDIWLKFDDLAAERVVPVNIQQALKEESPYLLFYRVQPLIDEEPEAEELPAYTNGPDSLDLVDQKLANYNAAENSKRISQAIDTSRRGSVELASPEESRGRISFTDTRRTSLQPGNTESVNGGSTNASIRTLDHIITEPVTPLDTHKSESVSASSLSASTAISRETTNGRPTSHDSTSPGSGNTEKRFSMSMSRLTSVFSQKTNPDIVINEAQDDVVAQPQPRPSTVEPPAASATNPGPGSVTSKSGSVKDSSQHSPKLMKEKKRKFMSKSRRGSGDKGKAPDRECVVM